MSDDPRDRLPPPAIEPLPDLAWARVERAVLADLDTPETRQVKMPMTRWPMAALLGGALAGAAALIVVIATRDAPARAPVVAEAELPSRIVTGDAATEVSYGDAHVTVAPASAVVLDGAAEHGVLAVLERGSAAFVVAPRRGRPPFTVQAGAVGVRVIGTEFSVTRHGGDDAEVTVEHGVVEVIYRGRRFEVSAGERWSSLPDVTATGAGSGAGPALAARDRDATPDRADRADRADKADKPDRDKPAKLSAQERFEAAATLEATDPAAALAAYRELARGRGPWAGNALYAMGRLQHDRGQRDSARVALTAYLHRFPRGANVADARALLAELKGASP